MPNESGRIKKIFDDARRLRPKERDAFVEEACGGDEDLRRAVRQLFVEAGDGDTLELPPGRRSRLIAGELVTERFRIRRFLGGGGMGEVYEAEDLELGGFVALKTLHLEISSNSQFLARLRREAQLARRVTHPNVCRVFDVGTARANGVPLLFLTMELLEGETLAQRLRRTGPLSEESAMPLIQNMLDGLSALHGQGIIHRDFKPGNVMVASSRTGSQRAVLTDFGLARDIESEGAPTLTHRHLLMGTPAYMAPEQFQGALATRQSDIYSLGVVLHELLTGRKPFQNEHTGQDTSELLSPRMDRLIMQCLAPNPADRPQSIPEIAGILDGIAPARRSGIPEKLIVPDHRPGWRKRLTRRQLVAAAIGLVAVAAAFSPWWEVFRQAPASAIGSQPAQKRLVAIIPFRAINQEDRALRALSDGMAEMLASKLTELEEIQESSFSVVPASEIFGRKIDSADSARKQYGVSLAVTGSIQRIGKSLQFTANLVDAVQLRQVRATSFEATDDDLRALRDGVISRVVGMLDVQASPQAERALESKETNRASAYFAYLEGRGYLYRFDAAGNVERAITSLERSVKEDPSYALAHAALGEAYWRKALNTVDKAWADRAVESGRKAVQLGGSLAIPHIKLGEIYAQNGQQQEAIREFQLALKSQPGSAEAYRGLGRTYAAMGLNKEAEEAYLQAARLRPNDWYAHNLLGVFYYNQGRYAKAEQAHMKARELTPDNEYPYRNLGMLYIATGKFDQAKREFERSNAIKPSFLAHLGLGRLHYYADRPREAVAQFKTATEIEPNNLLAWGGLGDAYAQIPGSAAESQSAYVRAIDACERRLALAPKENETRAYLASFHARLKNRTKALETLAVVTDAPTLTPNARFLVALTYEILGERRLAIKEFESLLSNERAVTLIQVDPSLRDLKKDPEFGRLLKTRHTP